MANVKRFNFHHTKAIAHCQSASFDEFLVTLKVVFKIKGACNASNDTISVISVTNSNSLVYRISDLRTFNFCHTKAIDCRSECFVYFQSISMFVFLHSQELPLEGLMV